MKAEQQLPRNALVWIILAQFSLVAPHFQRIPAWILASIDARRAAENPPPPQLLLLTRMLMPKFVFIMVM